MGVNVKLPEVLNRDFLEKLGPIARRQDVIIEVPSTFDLQVLCEGPALWWSEYLRRQHSRIALVFKEPPPSKFSNSDQSHLLTTTFGHSLIHNAEKYFISAVEVDKSSLMATLSDLTPVNMDQLSNSTGTAYVCKMPLRMLPQAFKNRTRTRFASRDDVKAAFANGLLSSVYSQQLPMAVDSAVEVFFQLLKNAFEEHVYLENSENVLAGTYGVHLRRFKVTKRGDAADLPEFLKSSLISDRKSSSHLCLTIVDLGRGIAGSLKTFGLGANMDLDDLLSFAFRPGVTTKKTIFQEQQPGYGLTKVWHSCINLEASLFVEGANHLFMASSKSCARGSDPLFKPVGVYTNSQFGTAVSMIWREKGT